jgi:hypothetical protein
LALLQSRGRLFSGVCGTITTGATGTIAAGAFAQRRPANWTDTGRVRNFDSGWATVISGACQSAKSARPYGYLPPKCWILPRTAGGIASRGGLVHGTGALTASGALGRNILAALAGTGALTATGSLIVSAVAALAGTGTVSTADLLAILQAQATLAGTSTATATASALGWALATLAGTGTLTGVRYATGALEAEITPFTTLSPENLAAAVWDAVAADNDATGTMGEKLNDAGSASNPWTEVIEGTYTAAELLRVIAAALAGELSGAGGATITILGVDGATDRIVATVTPDGNRTHVTLDGS